MLGTRYRNFVQNIFVLIPAFVIQLFGWNHVYYMYLRVRPGR